jgi:ribosomal protein S18 acetylase RimI-like enzyme
MSVPKYLIDTNVFIGLEDTREVTPEFASFLQLASKHGLNVSIHEAARDDIARDKDHTRKAISLSKLAKFPLIGKVRKLTSDQLAAEFGLLPKPNDVVDATLLHALKIGVADFLITEDTGLHDRARRHSAEISRRVLYVADATSLLRTTYEPIDVPLRFVEEVDANSIPVTDAIFDSLRDGYPEFDDWWRDKCVREQRKCWVVTDEGEIAGLVVRKEETASNTDAKSPGRRFLKVSTFKVRPESRGVKLGELLLKQVLWFAQKNGFDVAYLTTFPTQTALISLIEYYGFNETHSSPKGELMFERRFSNEAVEADANDNLFDLARLNYPRFCATQQVQAYGVPIKEAFHDALFPELRDDSQPQLFEAGSLGDGPRTPGNTIRKVYLCRAAKWIDQPGAILFFYKGKSQHSPSQALTTIGIFEGMTLAHSSEELRRLAGGRSVYSERQLISWRASLHKPVKVIDFLLIGYITPAMSLPELRAEGVFRGHPPQSIFTLKPNQLTPIIDRFDLGFALK